MSLVNSLKKTLFFSPAQHDESTMTFVKTRRAILNELRNSMENGTLIGVYSKPLGEGMFLVGINNIEGDQSSEIVVFETYDQSGMILNRTTVSIDEIKMVCPFEKKYKNPVLYKIQFV
jgi:hypothetical protein